MSADLGPHFWYRCTNCRSTLTPQPNWQFYEDEAGNTTCRHEGYRHEFPHVIELNWSGRER